MYSMNFVKYVTKEITSWKISFEYINTSFIKIIPSRRVRRLCYRILGACINSNTSIFRSVNIRNPKGLIIEEGCSIGPNVLLDARRKIKIERNVTIACDAIIWSLHHDMNSSDFHTMGGQVTIGEYAWLCSRCIILPGTTIGKGAVIASGAIVTKDVEPYAIMAGIPAKKIGERKEKNFTYCPATKLHII